MIVPFETGGSRESAYFPSETIYHTKSPREHEKHVDLLGCVERQWWETRIRHPRRDGLNRRT
jgi:hypothetical protein